MCRVSPETTPVAVRGGRVPGCREGNGYGRVLTRRPLVRKRGLELWLSHSPREPIPVAHCAPSLTPSLARNS